MIPLRPTFAFLMTLGAAAAWGCGNGNIGSGGAGGSGNSSANGGNGNGNGNGGVSDVGGGPVACHKGETHACYTGPSGTVDRGNCKAGVQDCTDNGVFGACHDQVLPHDENCSKRGDEDCDGNGCSDAIWNKTGGDSNAQAITAVAIDEDGNSYAVGSFKGALDLGKAWTSTGSAGDLFVAKFDGSGKLLWGVDMPASAAATATGVAVDSNGNVAISITAAGAVALPTMSISGTNQGIVALFSGDKGDQLWAKAIKSSGTVITAGVAIGKNDAIVVGGDYDGNLTCAGGCPTSAGDRDAFARAFNTAGNEQWTQGYGGSDKEQVTAISTNTDGAIFLSGTFLNATKLNGKNFTSQGDTDIFVVRATAAGAANLAITFGTAGADTGVVAGRGDGSFVVGGQASDLITIDMVDTSDGDQGAFVFAFNPDGSADWAHGFGRSGTSAVTSISSDFDGNIWLTGTIAGGKANFGAGLLNNPDADDDVAISFYDGGGGLRWGKDFGGPGAQTAPRIAVNRDRYSVFSVVYQGTIDFGIKVLTSNNGPGGGSGDIALVTFQP